MVYMTHLKFTFCYFSQHKSWIWVGALLSLYQINSHSQVSPPGPKGHPILKCNILVVYVTVGLISFFLYLFGRLKKLTRLSFFGYITFCGRVPWLYQYWPGGFMLFVVLCPGTPKGSTGSGSGFKASQ